MTGYYVTTLTRGAGSHKRIHADADCHRLRATAYNVREATAAEVTAYSECAICANGEHAARNPDYTYYRTLREAGKQ